MLKPWKGSNLGCRVLVATMLFLQHKSPWNYKLPWYHLKRKFSIKTERNQFLTRSGQTLIPCISQPTNRPTDRPTDQPTNQPTNQRANPPTHPKFQKTELSLKLNWCLNNQLALISCTKAGTRIQWSAN